MLNLFVLFLVLLGSPLIAAESKVSSCFSCNIKINELDQPIDLTGNWLFTRQDLPDNRLPDTDTRTWKLVKTPGPWSPAYDDGEYFSVGWYRGNFEFAEKLIGQKAIFYVDAHLARMKVFLDGEEVFKREGAQSFETFYSFQPVPIVIPITKTRHVISFRIQTPLMVGVYQLPFQIRPFKAKDPAIIFFQILGSEFQHIAAYVLFAIGLFFLLIYSKTQQKIYQVAALTAMTSFPFYAFQHDTFIKLFDPDTLWLLHYLGLPTMAYGHYRISQIFHREQKIYDRFNQIWVLASVGLILGLAFYRYEGAIFHPVRKASFLLAFAMATVLLINLSIALRKDRRLRILFVSECVFWSACLHDILLALGIIESVSFAALGTIIATSGVLYTVALMYVQTFVFNRRLLDEVEHINQNLEATVVHRTRELFEKTSKLNTIFDNLNVGIMAFGKDLKILTEHSSALLTIFDMKEVAGKSVEEVLFTRLELSAEARSQLKSAIMFTLDDDILNFELNRGSFPREVKRHSGGNQSVLALEWGAIKNQEGLVQYILVTLSDVTEVKRLERESEILKLRSAVFEALMNGHIGNIQSFLTNTQEQLNQLLKKFKLNGRVGDFLMQTKRQIHTIKGTARSLEFTALSGLCHELEGRLEKVGANHLGKILIETSVKQLLNAVCDLENVIKRILSKIDESRDTLTAEVEWRSVEDLKAKTESTLETFAKRLWIPTPELDFQVSGSIFLSKEFEASLSDSLLHLVQNSLDHGIETPDERLRLGKPLAAKISIDLRLSEDNFVLEYSDDGRGLDLNSLRQKIDQPQLSDNETANLVFRQGFTTRSQVTETSGRGVGMEIVAFELLRHGGTHQWVSPPKNGRLAFSIAFIFPRNKLSMIDTAEIQSAS